MKATVSVKSFCCFNKRRDFAYASTAVISVSLKTLLNCSILEILSVLAILSLSPRIPKSNRLYVKPTDREFWKTLLP